MPRGARRSVWTTDKYTVEIKIQLTGAGQARRYLADRGIEQKVLVLGYVLPHRSIAKKEPGDIAAIFGVLPALRSGVFDVSLDPIGQHRKPMLVDDRTHRNCPVAGISTDEVVSDGSADGRAYR